MCMCLHAREHAQQIRGGARDDSPVNLDAAAAGLFAATPAAQRTIPSSARRRTPRHAISAYDATPLRAPGSAAVVFSPVFRDGAATAVPSPGAASAGEKSWLVVDPESPFGRSGAFHELYACFSLPSTLFFRLI